MNEELINLIPFGVFVLAFFLMLWVTRSKKCRWYWDGIDHCFKTQCGSQISVRGYARYHYKFPDIQNCSFCGKPVKFNPFVERTDGKP